MEADVSLEAGGAAARAEHRTPTFLWEPSLSRCCLGFSSTSSHSSPRAHLQKQQDLFCRNRDAGSSLEFMSATGCSQVNIIGFSPSFRLLKSLCISI